MDCTPAVIVDTPPMMIWVGGRMADWSLPAGRPARVLRGVVRGRELAPLACTPSDGFVWDVAIDVPLPTDRTSPRETIRYPSSIERSSGRPS